MRFLVDHRAYVAPTTVCEEQGQKFVATKPNERPEAPGSRSETPIAFLVDGDNASSDLIAEMLAEAARYGETIVRRVYGDWTHPRMAGWKAVLHEHAILPVIQVANTSGKNATDSALIIDAIDILHHGVVKGFCLVSSDSDFTRLAMRLRDDGLFVMGIGKRQTPESFIKACNIFVLTDNLKPVHPSAKAAKQGEPRIGQPLSGAVDLLQKAFDAESPDGGFVHLSSLVGALRKFDPSFDPRSFGYKNFVGLLRALPDLFVMEQRGEGIAVYFVVKRKGV